MMIEKLSPWVYSEDLQSLGIQVVDKGGPWLPGGIESLDVHAGRRLFFIARRAWRNSIREVRKGDVVLVDAAIASELSDQVWGRIDKAAHVIQVFGAEEMFYRLVILAVGRCSFRTEALVSASAQIQPGAYIASFGVSIADGVRIGPGAVILPGVSIGRDSDIAAGAVIGADGFQHRRLGGAVLSVPHDGRVIIGERVVVGPNSVVAKGMLGQDTSIGNDAKIDANVTISHNCRVGAEAMIAANVVISGSVDIGTQVWIGPGAILSNGIRIGPNATVGMGSTQMTSLEPGKRVIGPRSLSLAPASAIDTNEIGRGKSDARSIP